jgi:hypothetical protein
MQGFCAQGAYRPKKAQNRNRNEHQLIGRAISYRISFLLNHSVMSHTFLIELLIDLRLERRHSVDDVHVHDDGSHDHLRDAVSQTGHASGLTQKVTPANDPRPDCDMLFGDNMLCHKVHATSGRISRNQLRH